MKRTAPAPVSRWPISTMTTHLSRATLRLAMLGGGFRKLPDREVGVAAQGLRHSRRAVSAREELQVDEPYTSARANCPTMTCPDGRRTRSGSVRFAPARGDHRRARLVANQGAECGPHARKLLGS